MYPGAHLHTTPNKPAVIMADTGRIVTFAELESNSIQIARHLQQLGLRRGDHLAVLATNSPRLFDLYWAAMRSGLYLTMVNWHLTAPEAAYIVNDCGAKAVIVDAALDQIATALRALIPGAEHLLSFGGPIPGSPTSTVLRRQNRLNRWRISHAAPTCSTPQARPVDPRGSNPPCPTARSASRATR